jgi:hypothetical protein
LLQNEVLALASLPNVKSIVPLGVIDQFFPIYVTANKTPDICRTQSCEISVWLRSYDDISGIEFDLAKENMVINRNATLKVVSYFQRGDEVDVGELFRHSPASLIHKVEIESLSNEVVVVAVPVQPWCAYPDSYSEKCRTFRANLSPLDVRVFSSRNSFLDYNVSYDEYGADWVPEKCN